MMQNFSMAVRGIKNYDEYKKLVDTLKEFDLINYVFEDGEYYEKEHEAIFSSYEEQEWQNGNGRMIILSEEYPTMMFELTAISNFSMFRMYYQDGLDEMCVGEPVFEKPKKIQWDKALVF